ncbi:MAG: methyltransferase domain-containing protein [Gaiellaceae bacterium]
MGIESVSGEEPGYLLAGQASELERLQLQSRVWEPSGRRLLEQIGDGHGARALDFGCGVLGWLRILSEWVGPDGEATGADIDEAMLADAERFAIEEGLQNVRLVKDDPGAPRSRSCSAGAGAQCRSVLRAGLSSQQTKPLASAPGLQLLSVDTL